MEKFEVLLALENLREQKAQWREAKREFDAGYNKVLDLLCYEAARAYMSIRDVSQVIGLSPKHLRPRYNRLGLTANQSKSVLADHAAKALNENAELLGIQPHEIDLMSPLAYLPMGDQLRRELEKQTAPSVTEFPETDRRERMVNVLEATWLDNAEAKTVDSPRGHCERLADALLKAEL